jgi:threonine dehydrogenase-like Zn-dependent dehydrogenase
MRAVCWRAKDHVEVCYFCRRGETSLCDNTNPNAWMEDALYGESGAGLFRYSHLYGGYRGGQAEYVSVPFSDFGPVKVPEGVSDERVLFLSDIFPRTNASRS